MSALAMPLRKEDRLYQSGEGKLELRGLVEQLQIIKDLDPFMSLPSLIGLITLMLNEGDTLLELADKSGCTAPALSRFYGDLSTRKLKVPEELAYTHWDVDPDDARFRMFSLAPTGEALADALVKAGQTGTRPYEVGAFTPMRRTRNRPATAGKVIELPPANDDDGDDGDDTA